MDSKDNTHSIVSLRIITFRTDYPVIREINIADTQAAVKSFVMISQEVRMLIKSASRGSIIVLLILKSIFFTCFITLFLKRDLNTNEHAVAERVTMKETHIILLDDRKLYSTREDTVTRWRN
jgi:hypothetical protein